MMLNERGAPHKPDLVWLFFGRRWVRLPVNVYVIDHADSLVLFDTGQNRAVVTDPDYNPDRINGDLTPTEFASTWTTHQPRAA